MYRTAVFTLLALVLVSCQPMLKSNREATATAYAAMNMKEAMRVAEESALAQCNLDLDESPEEYISGICELSTELTCSLLKEEIKDNWEMMQEQYISRKMECTTSSSRLLEVGEQYGKRVQYWQVNLEGVEGFSDGVSSRAYWLQIAEENGHWKFNRSMDTGEVSVYLALDNIEKER